MSSEEYSMIGDTNAIMGDTNAGKHNYSARCFW